MAEQVSNIMAGKRGLIMGVANDHSIAWGIARTLAAHGAEIAFTYQGEAFGRRVKPLADSVGSDLLLTCDVEDIDSVNAVFDRIEKDWGKLDFFVHAIWVFRPAGAQRGLCQYQPRKLHQNHVDFVFFVHRDRQACGRIDDRWRINGHPDYGGSTRVMPNYNVMGVAKAALEASVRYLASDYGPQNIRVNAISAGPMRTLAGAGISDSRAMYNYQKRNAPLRRTVTLDEVGGRWPVSACLICQVALPARCISSIPVILLFRCRAWKRSTPPIRNSSRQAVLRG